MREFKKGDLIGYNSPDEGYIYGIVAEVYDTELEAEYADDPWETFTADKNDVDYIEPVYLDDETVRRFARYEISFAEAVGGVYPPQRLRAKEQYRLTIDDLLCVLKKASGIPLRQFYEDWFIPIRKTMSQSFVFILKNEKEKEKETEIRFLPSEDTRAAVTMLMLQDLLLENHINGTQPDYSEIIDDLLFWKELFSLPFEKREYPDYCKADYISQFDRGNMLDRATNEELALFRKFVEELCAKGNKTALYAKAYGCYGGNRAFPCDWKASRDALLKLSEIDDDPSVANTLGYIYYYGRCTDGDPEYDKAFRYFSIGAAGGIYESQYKLSDMFCHGYGVPKNDRAASEIIWKLYDENIKYIFDNELDCNFADVALRTGNLFKNGIGCRADYDHAYYYYLQADFAIRMRMLEDEHYGDASVADGIQNVMDEVLPLSSYEKRKKTVRYYSLENLISRRCRKHRQIEMKVRRAKDGELLLKFRIIPKGYEEYQPKFFITEPRAHFCGLCESVSAKTVGIEKLYIGNRVFRNDTETVVFDEADDSTLYLYGNKVAEFVCDGFSVTYPDKDKHRREHFVSVTFYPCGKEYDYICNIPDVKVGDLVVVGAVGDEKIVEVVRVFDKDSTETALPISRYKSVRRKAP